ncbi:MAG: 6-carboxytetrahydropterin synthase [candidate division WOR-3 bacterium]|nr:6-carboxytetrahydropterin synthase [candidate division WOR-3 bacterium]MCX7947438.1 6-carboxytetrahydropterin synthase [candidate division WOR-3 bacterium]MDW8150598.1 6-carboxytetrahydropterin synthase [candidate division WOR-3 bacterium]
MNEITITRRFYFCSSHRYYLENLSFDENLRLFGKTIYEHGHNYTLFVSIRGNINKTTNMVMNISEIKNIVNEIIEKYYDHKNLNLDNPFFKNRLPTTENIALSFWHFLSEKLNLYKILVYEGDEIFSEYKGEKNMLFGRVYKFSAGHRLYNENLSDEENNKLYGKCANKNGHGHDYKLEIYIEGKVDKETGFIVNINELDKIVNEVLEKIDHKFLNYDVEFFRENLPTTENILIFLKMRLSSKIKGLKKLRIYETENNIFEIECV